MVRSFFKNGWRPLEVHFEHASPADPAVLRTFFKAPVRFGQSSNRLIMSLDDMDRPYRTEDHGLTSVLERHILDLYGDRNHTQSFTQKVETLIDLYLGRRAVTIELLAEELGISPRTVQRRLEQEGVGLRDLLKTHRRSLASTQLAQSGVKMMGIAQSLGYADASAFCRAFKGWTGEAPSRRRGPREPATGPR